MREQRALHVPPRASRTAPAPSPAEQEAYELADDEVYYPQRMPTSARRYTTPDDLQVIQQGNKRIVIHHGMPPPKQQGQAEPAVKQRHH